MDARVRPQAQGGGDDGVTMTALRELAPYLWYLAGSICFAVGTLIVIVRALR